MCTTTIHLGQTNKKRVKDMASSVMIELPHKISRERSHTLHEKYNTGYAVSAIPHSFCRKARRGLRQPEIQQESVVHLLLESAVRRNAGIPCLPVPQTTSPPKRTHSGGAQAHSGYAPSQSRAGHDRALASVEIAWLYSLPGKSVPCAATPWFDAAAAEKEGDRKSVV